MIFFSCFSRFFFVFVVWRGALLTFSVSTTNNFWSHTSVQPVTCTIYRLAFTHQHTSGAYGIFRAATIWDNEPNARPYHQKKKRRKSANIPIRQKRIKYEMKSDESRVCVCVCMRELYILCYLVLSVPIRCAIKMKMSGRWVSLSLQETNHVFLVLYIIILLFSRIPLRRLQRIVIIIVINAIHVAIIQLGRNIERKIHKFNWLIGGWLLK